jgi:hypothetical protein
LFHAATTHRISSTVQKGMQDKSGFIRSMVSFPTSSEERNENDSLSSIVHLKLAVRSEPQKTSER